MYIRVVLFFVGFFFFFQAEDGIRDYKVTGVQTCALPICWGSQKSTRCQWSIAGRRSNYWRPPQRRPHNMDMFYSPVWLGVPWGFAGFAGNCPLGGFAASPRRRVAASVPCGWVASYAGACAPGAGIFRLKSGGFAPGPPSPNLWFSAAPICRYFCSSLSASVPAGLAG